MKTTGGNADVLPVAVTADLHGLIRALRQQPSIAGTIGLAGIDDYFFVAVRVVGSQVSVLLSDIGAALDYPLAEQVLDYLDIPVPDEEDLDQVLPVGRPVDLRRPRASTRWTSPRSAAGWTSTPTTILGSRRGRGESIAARLGFGPAMERALDVALGA